MTRPGAGGIGGITEVTPAGDSPCSIHVEPGRIEGIDAFGDWVLFPAARVPAVSMRTGLQAVLFDLDGVLVDTAEFHYRAWRRLADELGLPFDRQMYQGFRGVARMECLDKLLGCHRDVFAVEERDVLADRKNGYYLELVGTLRPGHLATGARVLIDALHGASDGGVRCAVVSASRNARRVLERLEIAGWFDAIIDGTDVSRGKPDPQCFLLAAQRLRVSPCKCVVIEDAEAGVQAARAAGMACVGFGIDGDQRVDALGDITISMLEAMVGGK